MLLSHMRKQPQGGESQSHTTTKQQSLDSKPGALIPQTVEVSSTGPGIFLCS